MLSVFARQGEKSWGFMTEDAAEAWEPGTGNVITYMKVKRKEGLEIWDKRPARAAIFLFMAVFWLL